MATADDTRAADSRIRALGPIDCLVSYLVAPVLGFIAALSAMVVVTDLFFTVQPSQTFEGIGALGGGALFTYRILRGRPPLSSVFARGFLTCALAWFAMVPGQLVLSGKVITMQRRGASGQQSTYTRELGGYGATAAAVVGLLFLSFAAASHAIGNPPSKRPAPAPPVNVEPNASESNACEYCRSLLPEGKLKCDSCGASLRR